MNTDALRAAARKLVAECKAMLSLERQAIQDLVGNTNVACMEVRMAEVQAALATPASETEKLPAKWRAETEKCFPSKFEPCNSCKQQLEDATEVEAALKADRQGG